LYKYDAKNPKGCTLPSFLFAAGMPQFIFPPQKYHSFARKYSVISKICSVSTGNMMDGVIIENQKAKHALKINTLIKTSRFDS